MKKKDREAYPEYYAELEKDQKELEKVLVVDQKKGGRGRRPDDLDSGSITIELPAPREVGCPGGVQPE